MSSFQDRSVGMYAPYRQADLGQLLADAEQLALQYASEYDAAERLARWSPREYDTLVAQAADAYQAKMAQLQTNVGQQAAAINQDYDARERSYADVDARFAEAVRDRAQRQRDEWDAFERGEGPYPESMPLWRPEQPWELAESMPAPGNAPDPESAWRSLLSWFS